MHRQSGKSTTYTVNISYKVANSRCQLQQPAGFSCSSLPSAYTCSDRSLPNPAGDNTDQNVRHLGNLQWYTDGNIGYQINETVHRRQGCDPVSPFSRRLFPCSPGPRLCLVSLGLQILDLYKSPSTLCTHSQSVFIYLFIYLFNNWSKTKQYNQ